jgi:hypothetical protein
MWSQRSSTKARVVVEVEGAVPDTPAHEKSDCETMNYLTSI